MGRSTRTRTGRLGWAALLAVAAIVAACGGAATTAPSTPPTTEPTPSAAPTPEPTPEPTPSPEPTLDLEALGAEYQAMATTLFETTTAAYDLYNNATTEDEVLEANTALEGAYRAAARQVEGMEFPPEVQVDVDELVGVLDELADEFQMAIEDPTYDNFDAVEALLPRLPEIGGRIREALGLPPPVTAPPD